MAQVKLAGNGFGGIVQGNFGTYQADTSGNFTVDTRDVPSMLLLGMSYLGATTNSYNTPVAPLVATAGQLIASAALSNGALSIANQPDVARQGALVIGAGTVALTAGTVTIVYKANDGTTQTDVLSAVVAASGTSTQDLTKGVLHITSATVAAVAGGATPFVRLNTTTALSVPVGPGASGVTFLKETIDTGDETVGTPSTVTLGTIAPTTAPNGTHTYSWFYTSVDPDQ